MIANDGELYTILQRLDHFQRQLAHLRNAEPNPLAFHMVAINVLAEIDRMHVEARAYLSTHPSRMRPPEESP